ncbi:NAD(P)-binding domain-containing protein [Arthrobacter sp. zg-Y40]|uniref:NAD(P)-binding domain-containing protein n=1 Tax=Arthrobacter sp. zg-Y40 TaxID=2886939 RepID=UPI001D153C15|nr:NAD(P)-binding domain-containing protein [Arthrobacter sp. zg-Y40]MCC3279185.1 NAD(P)-binding domain-containing protein [Arthrobacter sp. zg-Y40]
MTQKAPAVTAGAFCVVPRRRQCGEFSMWPETPTTRDTAISRQFSAVMVASGTLHEPSVPVFPGEFAGAIRHSADYKNASMLAGKRVLIVGAGNSGCDIAVDATRAREAQEATEAAGQK